ncbi:MAG TPA: hypothetical protein VK572_14245 [Burkholderiales bacterium]|nr:hypothetical protein [Burkholderiales bacterium]
MNPFYSRGSGKSLTGINNSEAWNQVPVVENTTRRATTSGGPTDLLEQDPGLSSVKNRGLRERAVAK